MLKSDLSVRNSGFSGRGTRSALEAGRSTEMSTVASGAAIMKIMSSTRITSMNGVTLISWTSLNSSSPWSRRTLIVSYSTRKLLGGYGTTTFRGPLIEGATVEIAADDAQDFGGGIGMKRTVPGNPA